MNKKDMKLWVKALRSGDYKQGKHRLYNKDTNSYCCLGVLDKIIPGKYNSNKYASILTPNKHFKSNLGNISLLDVSLAELNDDDKTFEEIADVIEKHYKEL